MGNMTEFLVTPEVLLQSAGKMEASLNKVKIAVSKWDAAAKETGKYLNGKTGEAFRKEADRITERRQQQIEELSGIIAELKAIADTYKTAEGENLDVIYGTEN